MTRSTPPSASPASTRLRSLPVTRFVSSSTRSGRSANRLPPASGTSRPVQQPPDAGGVLLGEHLGRRHQRALVAALHGGQQRGHGDDGLAGADVALQQPVHRVRRGEVGVDLGDHPALGVRQREAQRGVEAARPARRRPRGGCRRSPAPSPACASRAPAARAAARRTPAAAGPAPCRRSTPAGGCRAAPAPGRSGRAAGGRPPAPGRPGPRCDARSNAFSTQPAISHVLIWAFSLCG